MIDSAERSLSHAYPHAVKPSKLAHFVIRTAQFETSKRWWATVLDATPSYENPQLCFMTYDDEHHRIGIVGMPHLAAQNPGHAGIEHVAFTYDELGALLATYRRLKMAGIEPFWSINHGPTVSLYYRDPDGNKAELQYDVFTQAESRDFFASGGFEENFMGIIFDPEEMIARFESGEAIADITRRPPLPDGLTPWDMHRD